MITINIGGGLGNQLFQYATARSLAYKNNKKLVLDVSFFENIPTNDTARDFKINHFNIKVDKITKIKNFGAFALGVKRAGNPRRLKFFVEFFINTNAVIFNIKFSKVIFCFCINT